MTNVITPTDTEVFFDKDDIIVSKTDRKGRLTYVNKVFRDIAEYTEAELIGQPHSIVRHPDMPRAVFKLLWDAIMEGREIFAYVKNMTKAGHYYWVFAHVTPSFDQDRNIVGFHSNRRVPKRDVLTNTVMPLYAALRQEEARHQNGQKALAAGFEYLTDFVKSRNTSYDALIFSI